MGWLDSPNRVYLVTCAHSDASVPLTTVSAVWHSQVHKLMSHRVLQCDSSNADHQFQHEFTVSLMSSK